jgi:hypothetical protein
MPGPVFQIASFGTPSKRLHAEDHIALQRRSETRRISAFIMSSRNIIVFGQRSIVLAIKKALSDLNGEISSNPQTSPLLLMLSPIISTSLLAVTSEMSVEY